MLGISGLSGEMRQLHAKARTDTQADLAIRMFERSVCKQIAAMVASLEGADLAVFTGGIGEHDLLTGHNIRDALNWLQTYRPDDGVAGRRADRMACN